MNFWDQQFMYEKALATKQKRDEIIDSDLDYSCKICNIAKHPSEFVKHYMENSFVGKYQFLHECKQCKRERMIRHRQLSRMTVEWALWVVYKQILQWAKKRDIVCDIMVKDLIQQWEQQGWKCFYTGYDMEYKLSYFKSNSQIDKSKYMVSCDRLDNEIGYTKENIVLCCAMINRMKSIYSYEDFLEICHVVVNYTKK